MAGIIRRILVATGSLGALVSAGVGPATAAVIEADHYRFARLWITHPGLRGRFRCLRPRRRSLCSDSALRLP